MPVVRPKNAASLIVYQTDRSGVSVLLGRRQEESSFVPGVYVFPGGVMDAGDTLVTPATALRSNVLRRVSTAASARIARGLAVTAAREAHEETGLMLATRQPPSDTGWEDAVHLGLAPDLGRLDYIGRAITPSQSHLRYHARFFAVAADHMFGVLLSNGELVDLRYVPLEKCADLDMIDVTGFMLEEFVRFLTEIRRKTPRLSYRGDTALIHYE